MILFRNLRKQGNKPVSWFELCVVLVVIAWGINKFYFDLSGDSSAYDFMVASPQKAVDFQMNVCMAGECLYPQDWYCGFDLENSTKVEDCFMDTVDKVPPWTRLDLIRKYCGHRFAKFVGETESVNPKKCIKEGGTWGNLARTPRLKL